MKILIAEDDATSRLVLSASLKKLGHHVVITKNGEEALAAYEQMEVPILISDIVMPGMDGLELCRRIRSANRLHYTYIMLTTAGGKYGYLVGMRAGADDFVTKPFDQDQLAARLVVAERILSLQSQVKRLAGLLPICGQCQQVRDDENYWEQVESYLLERADAKFTHSYCSDCCKNFLNDLERFPNVTSAEPVPA